jgi:hypothetical protein
MHRLLRCAGLLILSLAFAVPTLTSAQEKKADEVKKDDPKKDDGYTPEPKSKKGKDKEKPKIDWGFEFIGKITTLEDKEDKALNFTVQVSYKKAELNPSAQQQLLQHQQQLMQHQMQLARARNAQERQNAVNQINQSLRQIEINKAQLYKFKDVTVDVKCTALENMRVRNFEPPTKIDETTGEFIKLTKEDREALKGTEGYPGYKCDSTKYLRQGQPVMVFLSKDTKTPASLMKSGATKAPDDLQSDLNNLRYDVIMIYIIADPPSAKDKK